MTTYYVGSGGNDGNAGTSWAARKETLTGAEDIPVSAGDTVYVGPGTYRETLTCDVSGSSGNPITYIGDVTGENTDGVGGVVRITGSDDDQTATRNNCVDVNNKDYRTFRGFVFEMSADTAVVADACENLIVEDCVFSCNAKGVYLNVVNSSANTVRRCLFVGHKQKCVAMWEGSLQAGDPGHEVENCVFLGLREWQGGVNLQNSGGVDVNACLFFGTVYGVRSVHTGAATVNVTNSVFCGLTNGILANTVGDIVEDYNTFWAVNTSRQNTNTGANSQTYPPLFKPPLLLDGYKLPHWMFELADYSPLAHLTGSSLPGDDLHGMARPTTGSKQSWGPLQEVALEKDTTVVHEGSASARLDDAGRHQVYVPVTGEPITVRVRCYREADYAGTNPQMVIRQPGQADRTTTDAGSASAWNELSDTFTPASDPEWIVVELVSDNTASSGSHAAYFDNLEVS